jgi:hypothetical protein
MKLLIEVNLRLTEGHLPSNAGKEMMLSIGGVAGFRVTRHPMQNEQDLLMRSIAGGNRCDGCKKGREELDLGSFSVCGRCKMVSYCSPVCQRKAWNTGHRQSCRQKGQIEVGDDMVLVGLSSRTELNGRFAKIIGPGSVEGKWLDKLTDASQPMSVSGDKLLRLRPAEP